ncbi:MAG: hypothetical protein NZ959_05445 [Armatimonadetes bacterium]|nr:hypothetical protein [Armatimonadota bacterium]MDW8122076.1 hypothetical protein [Armatimonadota bacterium]
MGKGRERRRELRRRRHRREKRRKQRLKEALLQARQKKLEQVSPVTGDQAAGTVPEQPDGEAGAMEVSGQ